MNWMTIFFFSVLFSFTPTGIYCENIRIQGEIIGQEDLFDGFIYFADEDKLHLKSIKKQFPSNLDSHQLGIQIVKTLIEGPTETFLEPTWPEETRINSLFIADDGKAYVVLDVASVISENSDTMAELLAIYSMVNSLTVNIPEIKIVKILIQGNDAVTLGGHVDLEYFYKTNILIVK